MKKLILLALLPLFVAGCVQSKSSIPSFEWIGDKAPDLSWAESVGAKNFPKSKIFKIEGANVFGDGKTLCTAQIQAAIDACAESGGGTVELAPGKYLTGSLYVKSGVNLHIADGVTLLGSTDFAHYPIIDTRVAGIEMKWPSAVVNIVDQKNAALTGRGTIDCQGAFCWDKYWEMRKAYEADSLRWIVDYDCQRVRGVLVSNSSDITIKDFTLMRTGFWGVHILYSNQCTVDGLQITNNVGGHGPSTDGIDIDSSTRILIQNCDVDCNDDNICIKAGRDFDGLRVNRPTEYVVVRNCTTRKGAGMITCGSETSGMIRNVLAYDNKAFGTTAVLRLKSAMTRGGGIENIYVTNVEADSVRTIFVAELNWNPSYSYSKLPVKFEGTDIPAHWQVMLSRVEPQERGYPRFKSVYVANVKATNTGKFIQASGRDDKLRIENMSLYNMTVEAATAGLVSWADNFKLTDVTLKIKDGTRVSFDNNTNLDENIRYE